MLRLAAFTTTVAVAVKLLVLVAVMVTGPPAFVPVTFSAMGVEVPRLRVTMPEGEAVQVTTLVRFWVVPFAKVPIAWSGNVGPALTIPQGELVVHFAFAVVITDKAVGCGPPEPPPCWPRMTLEQAVSTIADDKIIKRHPNRFNCTESLSVQFF